MRVVADSHILMFYLFTPGRLSDAALTVLGEAEDDAGIVVSAVTLGDLWYASHKTGPNSLVPGGFESLRRTVLDPATNFEVVPVTVATMEHFTRVPLVELADPFDRFILATAAQLGLPLVTMDRAMSEVRRCTGDPVAVGPAVLRRCRCLPRARRWFSRIRRRVPSRVAARPGRRRSG